MKLLAPILIVLLAASFTFAQTNSKDDAALKSLITRMANAQVNFDQPALDKIFTADYIEISPLGELDPRDKVMGFYKTDQKPGSYIVPALEIAETSIRNYGKYAIVITKLTYTVTSPTAKIAPRSIRATFVCRREGKDWKIASAQYTGIRAKT